MSFFESVKSMFNGNDSDNTSWESVQNTGEIDRIIEQSHDKPQLLYKHSSRCSICWFAKSELEKSSDAIKLRAEMYFVDVIHSRSISDYIAEKLGVRHESPQAILVDHGEVVWYDSHGSIKSTEILDALGKKSA